MSNENNDFRVESPWLSDILEDPLLFGAFKELERLLPSTEPEAQDPYDNMFCENDDAFGNSGGDVEVKSLTVATPDEAQNQADKTDDNQNGSNESSPMWRENMKRKKQCAKGKSTKKPRTTSDIGESSASRQQPKSKTEDFKTFIEKKSVGQGIKYVRDALNRQKKSYYLACLKVCGDLNQIPLPMLSDIKDIEIRLDETSSDYNVAKSSGMTTTKEAELKRRLVEVRVKLAKLNTQLQKDSTIAKNLERVFINNEGFSNEALRKELSSALPGIVLKETATKAPATAVKDQGSSGTRGQLRAAFSNLKDALYAMDNDNVDVSDFQGLEEALEKTRGGKTPNHLELIALRIEKARGKATEFLHKGIQVLVCAAIQEMEILPIENWNWGMLKKWGATLNKANKLGFRVEFAEKLLKNNLYAYWGHSNVG